MATKGKEFTETREEEAVFGKTARLFEDEYEVIEFALGAVAPLAHRLWLVFGN